MSTNLRKPTHVLKCWYGSIHCTGTRMRVS